MVKLKVFPAFSLVKFEGIELSYNGKHPLEGMVF